MSSVLLCLPAFSLASDDPVMPGVPNFWKVNDHVYRGAQPTDAGFQFLARPGIRTIVDLRLPGEHSQAAEQKIVEPRARDM